MDDPHRPLHRPSRGPPASLQRQGAAGTACSSAGRLALLAALLIAACADTGVGPDRPNIVLVMADDLGWGDVAYNELARGKRQRLLTPVLDEMAATGLRFDRFYASSPVCSPTRAAVLTGRHPFRYGVWKYREPLPPDEPTLARWLRSAGYATGHFGKWHLNGKGGEGKPLTAEDPHGPRAFGFDTFFSVASTFDLDPDFGFDGDLARTQGDGSDVIVDAAIRWMRTVAERDQPFLAVIWYGSPHRPIDPLPEYEEAVGGDGYCAEVYGIDHSLGTLRAALAELGQADDTLLWFCSDNGAMSERGNGGLSGWKGQLYEGGIRVPAVIEWPARIRQPLRSDVPASTSDIVPTVLAILGDQVSGELPAFDGQSLLPLFDGGPFEREAPLAFWHGVEHTTLGKGDAALVTRRWKLLTRQNRTSELFDLEADPWERTDRAQEQPEVVETLRAELTAWQESVASSWAEASGS